jgi:hypothetical protein
MALSPFHIWISNGSKRSSDFSKVTQLVSGRDRTWTWISMSLEARLFNYLFHCVYRQILTPYPCLLFMVICHHYVSKMCRIWESFPFLKFLICTKKQLTPEWQSFSLFHVKNWVEEAFVSKVSRGHKTLCLSMGPSDGWVKMIINKIPMNLLMSFLRTEQNCGCVNTGNPTEALKYRC